jgi:hypothetical protein
MAVIYVAATLSMMARLALRQMDAPATYAAER